MVGVIICWVVDGVAVGVLGAFAEDPDIGWAGVDWENAYFVYTRKLVVILETYHCILLEYFA